jgi:hypothetical protein
MKLDFLAESLREFAFFALFFNQGYDIMHHLSLIAIFGVKGFRACAKVVVSG